MSTLEIAIAILKHEEGFRGHIYDDIHGYATIGYGQLLSRSSVVKFPADFPNMPEPVAKAWLEHNVKELVDNVEYHFPELDSVRQAVLVSMMYQLGTSGFWKFNKTIRAILEKDFYEAEYQMMDSLWAIQTPERADRHATMMYTGVLDKVYEVN